MSSRYASALLASAFVATYSQALADQQVDVEAFETFFQSQPQAVLRLRGLPEDDAQIIIALREAMDDALLRGDPKRLSQSLNSSAHLYQRVDGLLPLARLIQKASENGSLDRDTLKEQLRDFPDDGHWFVNTYAGVALSALHLRDGEFLTASQLVQSALDSIPNTSNALVVDSQLNVAVSASALYGYMASPELYLQALSSSRDIKTELGQDFNRFEALTNVLYIFNRLRDHEAAERIAQLALDEPRVGSQIEGLFEAYYADLLNETGRYAEAKKQAQIAASSPDPIVAGRGQGELAIAEAGLGNVANARQLLGVLGLTGASRESLSSGTADRLLHTEALIAAAQGRSAKAVALMNDRLDNLQNYTLRANSADAASLLAHLENSRERQIEREASLVREAEMNAEIAEQKTQLNRALVVLLSMIGLALVASLSFLRYREKVNAERARLQDEALSAETMKTEFLGMINHELRTPLNGVIGISDALIHHSPDATTRAQAEAIQGCGEQLFELVESMIDMTTLESGKFALAPGDEALAPAIAEQVERWRKAADAKSLDYTHHIDPELSRLVTADAARFGQCVKILLSNATRFTHEGRVHLHATAEVEDGMLAAKVVVADTGQGISEEVQARLFKPFLQADSTMTRKYGGAGLSLAIGRKIARMMGGDITMTSAKDCGSEFVLTACLPLADGDSADAGATGDAPDAADEANASALPEDIIDLLEAAPDTFLPAAAKAADGGPLDGLKLLVVEDLPSNQDVIRLMVEPHGCECIAALSGTEALEVLRRTPVDVILMDVRMPGMDGVEATRRVRALDGPAGSTPIIVLTADATAHTGALAKEAGADMFLSKPVVGRELVAALKEVRLARRAA